MALRERSTMVLLTCEHGGNEVPREFRKLFSPHRDLLQTHRGWDPGTKQLAELWCKRIACELHLATVTRLLVDLNRSPNHRSVFSEVTRELPLTEKQRLLVEYHQPHRNAVTESIRNAIEGGHRVLHIGVHSFTPQLNDEVRNADIGLLFDPRRAWEKNLSRQWQSELRSSKLQPRVRLNYPYRGISDGLTTTLRKQFSDDYYAGIEIEVNQAIPLAGGAAWRAYQSLCIESLGAMLAKSAA